MAERGGRRDGHRSVRTHLNVVLAHPGKSLHVFRGISIFRTVSGWVGHVLLGDCVVTVAHGLLDQVGAL